MVMSADQGIIFGLKEGYWSVYINFYKKKIGKAKPDIGYLKYLS